ncbi:hypothetical protein CKO44_07800 [Rubrivivax gelatinosus]|uniref:phage tail assembly protein n=1 Tax=Rubrivivax gelatinosus TaxID=28068 RepID=UPI0019067653|nr:phage tail assembly protein [Rubrivivax gelatinosus]MBK1613372.1 hypothetical protein [Rubrivivax gelatinosus]MBZ8142876.1 hypothetical protein [Rubrivivax gelatinosus]
MSASTDLFTLTLVDGLPASVEGREIRYRVVKLRETNVADERAAQRLAERLMTIGGVPRLVVSDADFQLAMTMRHIEAFVCDGQRIHQASIDLDMIGRLSSHDLGLIEQRVFLINLAAEVRYGNIDQAEFDKIVAGGAAAGGAAAPQPGGQAPGMGASAALAEPGPALLADYAGDAAQGATQGHGR